ncbi:MAG: radical SAM protein [Kiritimatiellae bacterium]|nr:radical SAM protein [Kiritimatiellia bacterium]
MIGISKLYFGTVEASDRLRYQKGAHRKPIVVWNCTPACNLACSHCYAAHSGEQKILSTEQALAVIDDLAAFRVPVLLFSGGEPFARPDIRTLAAYAKSKGLRVTFSTNGTLIDYDCADWIRDLGVAYVGISIDGTEAVHDTFRRRPGAYREALAAIRRLRDRDVKVGLRVTMTRDNVAAIPAIFALMRAERVPRICLYHLVYTGRGREIAATDLTHGQARAALDTIVDETRRSFDSGFPTEVLTVDNHCDGAALYLKMKAEGHPNAEHALDLLKLNGGNSSGEGIACISWDGTVYPDQFWRNHPVGNVLEKPFSEIWGNPPPGSLLDLMRRKKEHVKGRCRDCRWLDICGGNFRARGEAVTGDIWGEDPTCYLTDEEIKVSE